MLTQIIESDLHLTADVAVHGPRDAPTIGQGLEPGGDVNAITIEIAALDNHVAKVDPDAKNDLPVLRQTGVGFRHGILQRKSAGDRFDGTGKFDEHTVA